MTEPSEIETLKRQIENWTNRTMVAEAECKRLLSDNHELWLIVKNLAVTNKALAWKITDGQES